VKEHFTIGAPFDESFQISVNVNQQGMFTATLPAEIVELWTEHGLHLPLNRLKRAGFFESDTLVGFVTKVKDAIEELCSEELVSDEKVLRYSVDTACAYAIPADGDRFLPIPVSGVQDGTYWHDGTLSRDSSNMGPYGIWMNVNVSRKLTYRFKATGKMRVEYKRAYTDNSFADPRGDDARWLERLCSLSETDDWRGRYKMTTKEMPCTPEACAVLRALFESLFAMNEKLKPFLEGDILKLLQGGGGLMLTGGVNDVGPDKNA